MTEVVVVGGGVGGLAASLFAARRGHDVVLVDRDREPGLPDPGDPRGPWYRRGVPQALHSHTFLGKAALILGDEAPDVLAAIDRCAYRLDFTERFAGGDLAPADGDEELRAIGCRRRSFERALLAAVLRETRVTVLWGHDVTGLLMSTETASVPHVTGVRTSTGRDVCGDLVVDASGARSSAQRWLERDAHVHPTIAARDSGFTYFTRWYRLHDGVRFPAQRRLPYADGQFATVATFPADDGNFSLTYMAPTAEPRRDALRDESVFELVLSQFALTAPWLDPTLADPVSDVRVMPGGKERRLDVCPGGRPLVSGFACLADAALSTNPTRGRGTTMAFMHAQILGDLLPSASKDPVVFAAAFGAATDRELVPWFESTVAFDRSRLRRVQAGVHEPFPAGVDPFERAVCSFSAYAEEDPVLYRALARILNMLESSDDAMAAPEVQGHLAAVAGRLGEQARFEGPTRAEFEEICSTSHATDPSVHRSPRHG